MKFLLFFTFIFPMEMLGSKSQQEDRAFVINNLMAFSEAVGYVKYFHPSDGASAIDWRLFTIYGAGEVRACETDTEVLRAFKELFDPIAPEVSFKTAPGNRETVKHTISNDPNFTSDTIIFWQHQGLGLETRHHPFFKSARITIPSPNGIDEKLFAEVPKPGEFIQANLGNGLVCRVPVTLSPEASHRKQDLETFNKVLSTTLESLESPSYGIGNLITLYNVIKYFYPYKLDKSHWRKRFQEALIRSFDDQNIEDFLTTARIFGAALNDGHFHVNHSPFNQFMPGISWEWVEGDLIITHVAEDDLRHLIKIGDIITHIEGRNSKDYFEDIYESISAATESYLRHLGKYRSLLGPRGSQIEISSNGKTIVLPRTFDPSRLRLDGKPRYEVQDNYVYLNLTKIEMDTLNALMPILQEKPALICDLRGYARNNHDFIRHLMPVDDTTSSWMFTPQIFYPDIEMKISYKEDNWIPYMTRKSPSLGEKQVIFLIDGTALSYSESILGYIEAYDLGLIIGETSAGTNGVANTLLLPGNISIRWTGMKALKHDGTVHHKIGFVPEILVTKTRQGIINGKDEALEKALELISN